MLSTIASRVPPRLAGTAYAVATTVRERGVGFVLWTLALGAALSESALDLFGPGGVLPRAFPLSTRPAWLVFTVSLVVALTAFGVASLRSRREPRGKLALYEENVRLASPLVALPFLLVLREPLEHMHPGAVVAIAAMTGVLTSYAAYAVVSERDSSPSRRARWAAVIAVGVATLAYTFFACRITIANHVNLNTGRSDLGYYLSIFRQTSQGHLLGCSLCGGGSHLTGHFDPILIPLSPLFLIYPFAETLLVLQTVWLAAGAIPVYLLVHHHVRHRGAAVAFAVAYLAYPALHGVNFFDFHSVALCIPLFLVLLYCLERGYRLGYYVALGLLLLVREDIPIALVFIGLFTVFSKRADRARLGWTTMVLAVVYFVTVKAVFMHRVDPLNTQTGHSGGYAYYYEAMIPAGRSTAALIGTLLSKPTFVLAQVFSDDKVDFMLKLLVPLFLLPLLARGRMLLTYGAALTLLASRQYLFSIHFQYTSLLIPFLFVLAAAALGRISSGELWTGEWSGPRLARSLAFGVLVTTLICSWKFGALVENSDFQGGFRPLNRDHDPEHVALARWLKQIALTIPKGSRIAGNSRIITHLGPVTSIDLLENRAKADYVVVNVASRPFGPRIVEEAAEGNLTLVASHEPVRLYKAHYKTHVAAPDGASESPEQ
ncbi:MAG TPA: DUF2079 domain-containing protein [Polyangiaceae bacterium]|jgi:uncharacterized membrane protein|nr:DUF2079 domain-containing protein [Polyangiaceae bacterium]